MHRLIPDGYRDCSNYGTSWCINKAMSGYDHQDSVSLCVFFLMQSHIPVLWRTKWEREVAFRIQSLWLWDQGHGMLKSYLTFFKGYLIIYFPCCNILVVLLLLLLLLLLLHFRCVFISHHQTSLKPQQTVVFGFWQKLWRTHRILMYQIRDELLNIVEKLAVKYFMCLLGVWRVSSQQSHVIN